jgi:long-chain fatty acid transport protein
LEKYDAIHAVIKQKFNGHNFSASEPTKKGEEMMSKSKFIISGILLSMLFLFPLPAFAQVDQLTNMSPEWIRTGNRNAATDSTDIVVYNPAGLVKRPDGLYINLGNQIMMRNPEHEFNLNLPSANGTMSFEQDSNDYIVPNVFAAYNKGPYSFFGGVYIPGNGATADYPDGSINTQFIGATTVLGSSGMFTSFQSDYLDASSAYVATELGVAYACNDKLALALGVRYIYAENDVKAGATFIDAAQNSHKWKLRYDTDADGFGGIVGVNYTPMDDLNIGLRYETRVKLDFEMDLKQNDFPEELDLADCTKKERRDLPAMFGIGTEYRLCPDLTAEVDFNWYFQKDADWGKASNGEDLSDTAGDCWAVGGAFNYQASEKWLLSIGTVYTEFDWDDIDRYYETFGAFETLYTDNWYIGTGFAWKVYDYLTFNFAVGQAIWENETIEYVRAADNGLPPVDVKTENATTVIAFGFDMVY